MNERHAALLGLRAFVLTSPYDVPAWLTDVLMALVRAAGEPAPMKKTVRLGFKTLYDSSLHVCISAWANEEDFQLGLKAPCDSSFVCMHNIMGTSQKAAMGVYHRRHILTVQGQL